MRELRARRSELATPASNERMCEKAARSGADLVFLDLEDACAPLAKEAAHATAVATLTQQDWGRTVRAVRINGLDTPWCHGDIIEVVTGARDALDILIVPKARSARDVWWVDVLLTQLETKLGLDTRIGLEVLVEESEGLANAVEIAKASDRLEAIIFGAGDLSASQRARVDGNFDPIGEYPGDFWHFARFQVLTAARAAGIDAIDAPYPAYLDPDGYRRSANHASLLGFDGEWAIHPDQIAIAHDVFSPTDDEIAEARDAIAVYEKSEADGVGAIGRDGKLVDAAHMRLARNVLHKAALAAGEPEFVTVDDLGTSGLRLEREGPIAWCVIDRPAARNALTPAMYYGLKRAVRLVNTDPDLGALIITGTGDVFAPGGDLGGRAEPGEAVPDEVGYDILPFLAIRDSQAPVIAAVNGICQAGGLLIAMLADIAVASDRATFRAPELLRGIPDATYAAVLPAHVGIAVARDLLFSARTFDAAEAVRLGVVSRVVPHDELRAAALEAAQQVLQTAPDARMHVKRMLNDRYGPIDYQTMFWALEHSPEPREGMQAFMEKRRPNWIPDDLGPTTR